MSEPETRIKLAVRDFVAPLVRTGSIGMMLAARASLHRGAELHGKIQARLAKEHPAFTRELYISGSFKHQQIVFEISGRIDCYFEETPPLLEEIKTTTAPDALTREIERYEDHPYPLQLKAYAYLYYLEKGVIPDCRLRLVSSYDESESLLAVPFDPEAFKDWTEHRLAALVELGRQRGFVRERRRQTGEGLKFPFESPRIGQNALCETVEEGVREGKRMLLQAPTGLGKTAAVMFPILKDGLLHNRQVFYITPKNTQHQVAWETVMRFQRQGHDVRALILTAKEKICMKEEVICDPRYCEYARGYYDKLNEHNLLETLSEGSLLERDVFTAVAEKYEVCPFELSLDMTENADIIICDYNYVFAPNAALSRYFSDEITERPQLNLIVDEAHNLYDRAQGYYSPELAIGLLHAFRDRADEVAAAFAKKLLKLLALAEERIRETHPGSPKPAALTTVDSKQFYKVEMALGRLLAHYLPTLEIIPRKDPLLEFYRYWGDFCAVLRVVDDSFAFSYHHQEGKIYDTLRITCCDASLFLRRRLDCFHAVAAFSATLKPFPFYTRLSGFDEDSVETHEFRSPFPDGNRKTLVIPQVSTTYRDRERNYGKIGEAISRILPVHKGNYMVFFPSFVFMRAVMPHVNCKGFRFFNQEPGMRAGESAKLLKKLRQKTKNVVIFAVQGGSFAEGLDYPGDDLIGAIVVGPALPAYTFERECMRDYFQKRYGSGFDYAYVYPGMTRVIQSAGRVIRSETDRGLIVLMGRRFLAPGYTEVLPRHWYRESPRELVSSGILAEVKSFWEESG